MIPLARLAAQMSRTPSRTTPSTGVPGLARTGDVNLLRAAAPPDVPRGWGPIGMLQLWWWRAKSRQELAELDSDRLRDVGIHPRVARRESDKPFWRA